ncbi:ribonuclease H1 domain-containing protein [Bacillus nitroreducens]
MTKYYAVKRGRKEGVYTSWNDCKEQVNGYPNAIYKSFSTYEEAINFIGEKTTQTSVASEVTAYIDGSYDDSKKLYSYAGILFLKNSERIEFAYVDDDQDLIQLRNVAGEIKAAMHVIALAIKKEAKSIDIYYDYLGIENWATKSWRAKIPFTQKYVEFIDRVKPKIVINFKKVKSHSGNKFNEEVDLLAKEAIANFTTADVESSTRDYDEIFKGLKASKRSVNLNVLVKNEVLNNEKIYTIFKKKWTYEGNRLKDIVDFKTLLDTENGEIIFKVNTGSNEEILKFKLKELKENG